ncbi:MAG TPA: hypothetical protein PKL65_10585 [Bacteroidales bacterium]|nr:hypothetical protein [Bacteroidales bacterium]HNR42667.1 hypothetical protein [Bacteroidales bacterium]HPM17855.1 hypothetical protein [Bacteroidales bacterium]HQH24749.1 hypothetical protein [Bacteroidales bacterium]
MKINQDLRSALPHLLAVIVFIIISFIYFYPVLEGKVLKANDSTVSSINSKEIRDFREKYGREPLWTNSIFSGMPAYLISTRYPGNLMKHVDTALRIFQTPVSVLILAMAGFYLLLIIFGADPLISAVGAFAYGFSSFLFQILAAGHNTQAIALAYMAPMIGSVYYAYKRNALAGAVLTAVFLSLEILANHPQITYYSMICLIVFIITELIFSIRQKTIARFLKTSALLLTPLIIAIGINFGNLYTVYEYGKFSSRGKSDLSVSDKNVSKGLNRDYITYWSYGIDETFNLLVPNFKGGSSKPFDRNSETVKALRQNNASSAAGQLVKYWGTQPGTDGPHYMGAIVIFLFIFGLVIVKGPEKWWLLAASVLSVMLAWGKNFMVFTDLFIDFFPGYNKFRAVTMILVIAQFCIPLLGILALKKIFSVNLSKKEIFRGLKIAAGITGGLLIMFLLLPGIAGSFLNPYESDYPDWLRSALVADRKSLLRADSLRSLILIILSAGTITAFLQNKLRREYSIIIIGLLILADLWSAGKRYLDSDKFERPSVIQKSFTPSVADEMILQDTSYHRVLNLSVSTFNDNTPTSYFHKSIGGYHGAKMKRYQELIDTSITVNIESFIEKARNANTIADLLPVFDNTSAINMLNAKYVIYNPDAPPLVNRRALGNAWFAGKVKFAANANEELSSINSLDPSSEAVVDTVFRDYVKSLSFPYNEGDTIYLVSYKPNELIYKCSCSGERFAVFSEIYYPAGWKSFIDGKESPHFRVNYVLRAMIVPEGSHEIRFSFEPDSYFAGNRVSLASSLLLILAIAVYAGAELKKKLKSP